MSTGSVAIPLLKAAPEPDQLADRLDGAPGAASRYASRRSHVADDDAARRAVGCRARAVAGRDLALTAESPVAWPSGAFVRVDRLDDEARAGIERSADFAAAIGSPVLTIHLFAPLDPIGLPCRRASRHGRGRALPALLCGGLPRARRHSADRERPARASDAHRRGLPLAHRRPLARPAGLARSPCRNSASPSTPPTPRSSARSPPPIHPCSTWPPTDELELERYVEELGPGRRSRTSLTRTACSARVSPTAAASWSSTR